MKSWIDRLLTSLLLIGAAISSKCAGQQVDTIVAKDTLGPSICRQVIVRDTMIAKGDTALMISFCAPPAWWRYHTQYPHGAPDSLRQRRT